ncbi:hydroxyacylglutathione hydrolase [Amaricoccus sp.]|uniref:hydroxyacylglutathione hydrolase n=1 Tax=Amaricoccus sp. TaxID=1872485 RepID=UPI001B74FC34|nr:hydroxyacylglutathione hydrolase [Amaricoccus sp.]MBP7000386.1 hydroxyacylglutathione hydrolase [Amaricoccus sp.]
MPLEIVTVPCRTDNYAYLVRDADLGTTTLVDAPEAGPIAAELDRRGWGLDAILITHHHDDHIAAVDALRDRYGAEVWGAAADARRLPRLDHAVAPGDRAGPVGAEVLKAHGHTLGHVAYHVPAAEALFSADSLMVMGCGRLFEGTAADMWETLGRLCALPPATRLYSGHEYTEANLRFARSLGSDAALEARAAEIAATRAAGRPTMGPTLALERETNPFLRAADADMKARVGMAGAPDVEVFAEIRRRKDAF